MRRALLFCASLVACGGDSTAGGPEADAARDSLSFQDAISADASTIDAASADSEAGTPSATAKWAVRYEHAKLGLLSQGLSSSKEALVFLSAEVAPAADFGSGGCNCGVGSIRFGELIGVAQLPAQTIQATHLLDTSPNAHIAVSKPSEVVLTSPKVAAGFPNDLRIRLASEQYVVVDNVSALTQMLLADSTTATFDKGDVVILDVSAGGGKPLSAHVIYGNNQPTIAIDAVLHVASTKSLYMVGRSNGTFSFEGTVVNGPGLFLVKYDLTSFKPQWARLYGGTPLQDIALGLKDQPQVGGRLAWDVATKKVVLTLPFKGTVDFGLGPLAAPGNSHAVAFALIDPSTGGATVAAAFPKGPGADGKPSRARVIPVGGHYVLFDTVWDTVKLGAVTVSATTPNLGDVYLAALDANGTPTQTRIIGGTSEDQANDVIAAQDGSGDVIVSGHSDTTIDFGTGALSTSAQEGEVWIARVPSP